MKTKQNIIGLAAVALLALFTIETVNAKDWTYVTNALAPALTNCVQIVGGTAIADSNSVAGTAFEIPQNVAWSILIPNNCWTNGGGTTPPVNNSNTVYYLSFSPLSAAANTGNTTATGNILALGVNENGTNGCAAGTNFMPGALSGYRTGKITRVTTGSTNNVYTPYCIIGSFQ